MTRESADATVLRADLGAYRRWFGRPVRGLGLLLGVVGGGVASAVRGGDGVLVAVLIAGAVLVTLGCILILIVTSRVVLTAGHVEHRRGLRRTRLPLDDLVGALAELDATPVGRTSQVLVLRRRSVGRRIRLNGAYWDQEDLLRVAGAAGVPVLDDVLTPRDFDEIAPGSMPWSALHPWLFGFAMAVPVIGLIVAGVIAWFDLRDIPPFDEQPPRGVAVRTVESQDELVRSLERTIGGRWERPRVRLVTCQDDDDYKGWSRRVSARLQETVVEETGEDRIVTPVEPTQGLVDAIGRTLTERGHPEPYVDPDELAELERDDDGYLRLLSVPGWDGPPISTVDVTFSGRSGSAEIAVHSPCETPRR